ncbi:hypothetical protein [Rhodococcus sp. EPR-157]|uniref:hypothetical protein n=1 Tax=Rhodococcus sp. EPR-157 TaxID=1813677 RepID=UPI000838FBF3|nr:hypothetical protein [Rhodococcus sp. EPR-157]
MTDPASHRRPDPVPRPQPERPEFAVRPLRPRDEPARPPVAFRVTLAAWAAVALVVLGIAAVVALNYDAVRDALETTVSKDSSGATATEVADTVTVTVLGSAAVAVTLLLVAGVGLSLASARKTLAGIILLIAGLATAGACMLFWTFTADAGDLAAGALRWGPLLGAGLAAIATVAAGTALARK